VMETLNLVRNVPVDCRWGSQLEFERFQAVPLATLAGGT
jgi:hypothetical protein